MKNTEHRVVLLAVCLLLAVFSVGCVSDESSQSLTVLDKIGVAVREDVTLFSCDNLVVAIPNEYMEELTVENAGDAPDKDTLISVYGNILPGKDAFWIFSIKRYDPAQYEQHLTKGNSGEVIFAKDEQWYYCYAKYPFAFGLGGNTEEVERWKFLHAHLGLEVLADFIARNKLEMCDDPTASLDPRDYPAREERLSVMAENEEIWIRMSSDSSVSRRGNVAGNGSIILTVYTQEKGTFIQDISYGVRLAPETTLLSMIREPSCFLSLEDVNGDGADDIRVLTDDLQPEGQETYRNFIWDKKLQQFVEDK